MSGVQIVSWEGQAKATTAQRHALYRLNFGRSLVHRLSKAQADRAIKQALERERELRGLPNACNDTD